MKTEQELHKIKEAFALATIDILDVFDELLTTSRIWVDQKPTVNDVLKNEEESNA